MNDLSSRLKPNRKGRYCLRPFQRMEIHESGYAYACCPSWLKKPIGNIGWESVEKVWNSPAVQEIRRSIHDGTYEYCESHCPYLQSNQLWEMHEVPTKFKEIFATGATQVPVDGIGLQLSYDRSCNLSCPSCRKDAIMYRTGPEYEERQKYNESILKSLFSEPSDRRVNLHISGSGDPFASKIFREFLQAIHGEDFPNLRIQFLTNGTMLTPQVWQQLSNIHPNINEISISVDAATEETYKIVRAGGNWTQLWKNVMYLVENAFIPNGRVNPPAFNFVVQEKNFHEMGEFVRLISEFGSFYIHFHFVQDWGTWSKESFQGQAIWREDHPRHNELLEVLRDPILDHPFVFLGDVRPFRDRALKL